MFSAASLLGFDQVALPPHPPPSLLHSTWPDRYSPKTLDDVCDQKSAILSISAWDGKRLLVVSGPIGCGKSTLIQLECNRRKATLVSSHDIESQHTTTRKNKTDAVGSISCDDVLYVHAVLEETSIAEIVRLVTNECRRVIVETTDMSDPMRATAQLRGYCECKLQAPREQPMRAWLLSRGLTFAYIVPGDLRATLLDAQLGAARNNRLDSDEPDSILTAVDDYEPLPGGVALEWSLKGVLSTRKAVLRAHSGEGKLPTHAIGLVSMLEYIWYAPSKSLDKRGKQIQKSHALTLSSKRRRVLHLDVAKDVAEHGDACGSGE